MPSDPLPAAPGTALSEFLPEATPADGAGRLRLSRLSTPDDLARLDTLLITMRRRLSSLDADLDQLEVLSEQVGDECRRIIRRPSRALQPQQSFVLIARAVSWRPHPALWPRMVIAGLIVMVAGVLQRPVPEGPSRRIPALAPPTRTALPAAPVVLTSAAGSASSRVPVAPPVANTTGATAKVAAPAVEVREGTALPFVGTLEIYSQPAGARVTVDGRNVGRTPLTLDALRAGSHVVWVEAQGYERWSGGVLVPTAQVTQVQATLRRDRGR